ncbi:AER287Wp [Eremothecium gossypii ATCC 10895]|uniref:AER287Wp n=1 Tax=Eremothecium gossypii (strain ATCC 10895 / CBS 109.51 / FGSC 9923 / NRRL Y-1056) TaxID=284811 RepID=Q756W8_EREGS|nr:AER287Wp [Eremothecium gossypii ATCC 10895]AAS52968.1 AER287Wp [Eremothecium gossypii ATCC 10895]
MTLNIFGHNLPGKRDLHHKVGLQKRRALWSKRRTMKSDWFWNLSLLRTAAFLVVCLVVLTHYTVFFYLSLIIMLLLPLLFLLMLKVESREFKHQPPARLPYVAEARDTGQFRLTPLFEDYPRITSELEEIVRHIVRDFVSSWYETISEDPLFPNEVQGVLYGVLVRMQGLLRQFDVAELLVLKLLPLITKHFTVFTLAYQAASSDAIHMQKTAEDMKNFELSVAVEFSKHYKRHQALSGSFKNVRGDIQQYLVERTRPILRNLIDPEELSSPFVELLSREIVSNCILFPLMLKLSNPDFWNITLIDLSKKVLRERTQVKELRKALSRELQEPHITQTPQAGNNENKVLRHYLVIGATGQEFELYLKYINGQRNIIDLASEKFSVLVKLLTLSKKAYLSNGEAEFQKRLQLSLNLIESRFSFLTGNHISIEPNFCEKELQEFETFVKSVDIEAVLSDSDYIQFFREFLISCHAHQSNLDFWYFVQGIKNPLEDPQREDMSIDLSEGGVSDIQNAFTKFLKDERLVSSFNKEYIKEIATFLQTYRTSDRITRTRLYLRARKALLLLQDDAYKKLQTIYFPKFRDSISFLKLIGSPNFTRSSVYARYIHSFDLSKSNLPEQSESKHVGIITSGDIDKALDNILNEDKPSTPTKDKLKVRKSYTALFGSTNRSGIFNDTLFLDDAMSQEYLSEDSAEIESDHSVSSENEFSQDIIRSDIIDGDIIDSRLELKDIKDELGNLIIHIDQLQKQLELLQHLILKAELTNNQSQLKLLRKSERLLSNELEYKELLKQQYTVLENSNSLFGRTKVSIKNYISELSPSDGKDVIYYIINVNHINGNQVTSWEIPRRYSEFYKLNAYLKNTYGSLVGHLQRKHIFPQKVKISLKYHVSKSLLYEERRLKLENYLRMLLLITDVCQDTTFRRFLTDVSNAFMTGDEELDARKSPLNDAVPSQGNENPPIIKRYSTMDFQVTTLDKDELTKESSFYEDERNFYAGTIRKPKSFVKPICDLFISLFSLNKSNSGWLRGRAIIVVLQQLLGSTIEKYIKDMIGRVQSEEKVYDMLVLFKDLMWVDGEQLRSNNSQTQQRTESAMLKSKKEASMLLDRLMIETCGKVVGFRSAKNTSLMIHAMLQNEYLNASLILEIFDVIVDEVFPVT